MCPAEASRLGLGGAGIGNHQVALSDDDARGLLDEAWACGVRLFDTAPHYGLGLSERRLGAFLADHDRAEVRVSTKVGRRLVEQPNPDGALDGEGFVVAADTRREWAFGADDIRATLEESLTRLGLDHVDVAYLHDPERWDLDAALRTGLPALHQLRDEGLVGRVGVGSMSTSALLAAASTGEVDELMVAGRHTLINREADDELLPLCVERGIDVVAAAVFNGGLLAGSPTEESTYDYASVPAGVLKEAQRLEQLCTDAGVPLAAAALQFPLRHEAVTSVVVGAVERGQSAANAELLAAAVPETLWTSLDRVEVSR